MYVVGFRSITVPYVLMKMAFFPQPKEIDLEGDQFYREKLEERDLGSDYSTIAWWKMEHTLTITEMDGWRICIAGLSKYIDTPKNTSK